MKKKFATLLVITCLIMVLVSGVIVCNATVSPEFLAATSYITLYGESSLSYTASGTETINDFSGNSYRFSLLNPQGYMIMYADAPSTVSSNGYVFLELDEESSSPYSYFTKRNITGDKLYAGPNEYYVRSGSVVYDTDGNSFSVGSDRYNLLVERSNEIKNSIESQSESVTSGGYTYIDNYKYFQKIKFDYGNEAENAIKCHIPQNKKNTCAFNAVADLLGYYNYFYDSELITISTYKSCPQKAWLTNTTTNFNSIGINDIQCMPTVTDDLVTKLVRYIYSDYDLNLDTGKTYYGIEMYQIKDTFDYYFNEYHTSDKKSKYIYSTAEYNENAIKSEINNGRPVILGILGGYIDFDFDNLSYEWVAGGHAVIAYGYIGNMLRIFDVNSHGNKVVSMLAINDADYLTFEYTGEHNHSTDMIFLHNGCYGTYCPCGQYTTCEHNSVDASNSCACRSCGQNIHNYVVNRSVFTATCHRLDCTRCGAYITEEHIFKDKLGGRYCIKCDYDTTLGGEITLKDPDKFN